jgi:hypothetical protein
MALSTTLPATVAENETLDVARALVREFRVLFDSGAGTAVSRAMAKTFALAHPFNLSTLMYDARQGWQLAHEAIAELIAERLACGQELGPQLASYDIDLLNPALPPRQRGPAKETHIARNVALVGIVSAVSGRCGLRPVRSRQSRAPVRRPSACAVVADAMAAEGLPALGERQIEKIWERFRHHVFRWEAMTFPSQN